MRKKSLGLLLLMAACLVACGRENRGAVSFVSNAPASVVVEAENKAIAMGGESLKGDTLQATQSARRVQSQSAPTDALNKAELAQVATQAYDRKIIRNATLEIELDQPEAAQRKAATIAETSGGFVVTSEARKTDGSVSVNVVVRVPSAQFNNVIEQMRTQLGEKAGGKILQDKTSGLDVTEEFVDLEARIKTKKALEDQFLVIMRSANKVSDALEVQTQIAEVRGEIEQMEGRRRLLENQAALSTITLALHTSAPIVMASGSGFWYQVRQAFADGIDAALAIILGVIRFVLVMIPVLVLIVLPLYGLWRWLRRRVAWGKSKETTSGVNDELG